MLDALLLADEGAFAFAFVAVAVVVSVVVSVAVAIAAALLVLVAFLLIVRLARTESRGGAQCAPSPVLEALDC